jgi:regulatory protein YycI of two-component signal transduction system YycFG
MKWNSKTKTELIVVFLIFNLMVLHCFYLSKQNGDDIKVSGSIGLILVYLLLETSKEN